MHAPSLRGLPHPIDPRLGCCALVAIKRRADGKARLAGVLPPAERLGLVRAMLAHVLDALAGAQTVRHIVVVSPERDDVPAHIPVLADRGAGLNVALAEARAALLEFGARAILVLPADLPRLTSTEIDHFVRAGRRGFALAPDASGAGTNALYLRGAAPFEFRFGADSRRLHLLEARRRGYTPRVCRSPGLCMDVDAPADLAALDPSHMATDTTRLNELLRAAARDRRPEPGAALALLVDAPLAPLLAPARELTQRGFGNVVTYSRKVFIPLTQLCRDVCHYCTFAKAPRRLKSAYLSIEEVLEIARAGEAAGCKEALFTLGDQPELRYDAARRALDELGCATTLEYVKRAAARVLAETGLLPHLNPGVMGSADFAALRPVAASMGLMLETASARLSERGGPHFGSPDKRPERRLATLRAAGEARVAMTSGLLIGIGETRRERIEALLALRELHDEFGHLQEIIIQNFRAKPGTKMARPPEPDAGGAALDHRRGAAAVRTGDVDPGAAEPAARGAGAAASTPASTTGAACRR